MDVIFFRPHALELVGYLPEIIRPDDPRPAKEQIEERYAHGGGWRPIHGWSMDLHHVISYPGDPPMRPLMMIPVGREKVYLYEHSWVAIVQPDGTFEIGRMD